MKNHIFSIIAIAALVFTGIACDRELVNPDEDVDALTTTSNYVKFEDEDALSADITDGVGASISFTLESLPNNASSFDVTYSIAGIDGISGTFTSTIDPFTPTVDVTVAIPADLLGSDPGIAPTSTDVICEIVPTDTLFDTTTVIRSIIFEGANGQDSMAMDTSITLEIAEIMTDTITGVEDLFTADATITLTAATEGVTLGRGTNTNALGEEIDALSIPVSITQTNTTCDD